MANEQKDNGPYALYGRRTEHEAEVRIESHDSLGVATDEADALMDAGGWHQVTVRDRNDLTVHVSRKEDTKQHHGGPDDMPPAA